MVPPKSRFVAYYRVSTKKQGRSGLGIEAQQETVREYLARVGGVAVASFTEVESGKVDERPQLEAALKRCRQTGATLVIAKLDRLGRRASFLFKLRDSGQKFEALDIPGANSLTLAVMIGLAQNEAETISKRTKEALAARRARGLPLGTRRDMSAYQMRASALGQATNRRKALERAKEIAPQIEEARKDGHTSLRAIAAYLNGLSINTPRGKQWTATAVAHAITYSQHLTDD